jgi:serine protease
VGRTTLRNPYYWGTTIEAINYATAMRSRGINIKLTNNSWGGAPFDQSLMTAIQNSGNAGMLFVASAGIPVRITM